MLWIARHRLRPHRRRRRRRMIAYRFILVIHQNSLKKIEIHNAETANRYIYRERLRAEKVGFFLAVMNSDFGNLC